MNSKTLTPKQIHLVSIAPNEEIMATLTEFVKDKQIKSGYILGIGAVKSARLGHYSVKTKKYTERKIRKPLELANLTGIITKDKIHLHATLSTQQLRVYAGHLASAVVAAAGEIMIVETLEEVNRRFDGEIGLDLLNLS